MLNLYAKTDEISYTKYLMSELISALTNSTALNIYIKSLFFISRWMYKVGVWGPEVTGITW